LTSGTALQLDVGFELSEFLIEIAGDLIQGGYTGSLTY